MIEIIERIESNPKTQKDIDFVEIKYSNESYRTQSQRGKNALIQKRNYEGAKEIMGDTIEDRDEKLNFETKKLTIQMIKKEFQVKKL